MNLPWSKSLNNGMVSLIDSAGHVMLEVYPGQILGVVPTIEQREEIADFILSKVNEQRT